MFDKIMVAVDGSEHSKTALKFAIQLAEKFSGKITVFNVYSTVVSLPPSVDVLSGPSVTPQTSADIAAQIGENQKKAGMGILEEAEGTVRQRGIEVEKILREGDAVKDIVAFAVEGKFDLIVLGHGGASRLSELLLGSVSEGVIHRATCPVLVVK